MVGVRVRQWFWSVMDRGFNCSTTDSHRFMALFLPILVDQAFVVLLNLLNTAMISSSGVEAVSAVNIVDSLNLFLVNAFIAVATGGAVIVAQYRGAENSKMVTKAAAQAMTAVTSLGLLLGGVLIIFHTPVLNLLFGQAEALVMEYATIYMIGSCATYPLFALYQSVVASLRGVGDTKASLYLSLILNGSYVLCNLLFITVLDLGIYGLIASLVIARLLGTICALLYMLRKSEALIITKSDILHIDFSFQKRILTIGVPFAAEQLFFNGGKLLTQTFIVQLGTLSLTINAIAGTLLCLTQITGAAMSLAIITLVGQAMGQRKVDDARKLVKSCLLFTAITMGIMGLVVLALFTPLVSLFSPPDEIISSIFWILLICVVIQPASWGLSFALPSALRASGDAKFTSIASMCSMWALRVVLGYLLGIVFGFGIMGVFVAMYTEWHVRAVMFYLRFRGNRWYQHNLIAD